MENFKISPSEGKEKELGEISDEQHESVESSSEKMNFDTFIEKRDTIKDGYSSILSELNSPNADPESIHQRLIDLDKELFDLFQHKNLEDVIAVAINAKNISGIKDTLELLHNNNGLLDLYNARDNIMSRLRQSTTTQNLILKGEELKRVNRSRVYTVFGESKQKIGGNNELRDMELTEYRI